MDKQARINTSNMREVIETLAVISALGAGAAGGANLVGKHLKAKREERDHPVSTRLHRAALKADDLFKAGADKQAQDRSKAESLARSVGGTALGGSLAALPATAAAAGVAYPEIMKPNPISDDALKTLRSKMNVPDDVKLFRDLGSTLTPEQIKKLPASLRMRITEGSPFYSPGRKVVNLAGMESPGMAARQLGSASGSEVVRKLLMGLKAGALPVGLLSALGGAVSSDEDTSRNLALAGTAAMTPGAAEGIRASAHGYKGLRALGQGPMQALSAGKMLPYRLGMMAVPAGAHYGRKLLGAFDKESEHTGQTQEAFAQGFQDRLVSVGFSKEAARGTMTRLLMEGLKASGRGNMGLISHRAPGVSTPNMLLKSLEGGNAGAMGKTLTSAKGAKELRETRRLADKTIDYPGRMGAISRNVSRDMGNFLQNREVGAKQLADMVRQARRQQRGL